MADTRLIITLHPTIKHQIRIDNERQVLLNVFMCTLHVSNDRQTHLDFSHGTSDCGSRTLLQAILLCSSKSHHSFGSLEVLEHIEAFSGGCANEQLDPFGTQRTIVLSLITAVYGNLYTV